MARRSSITSRGGFDGTEMLDGSELSREPAQALRVGRGDVQGLQPVFLQKGESVVQAFRRLQRECAGSGRPFVICLE